jgi:hypothetical protein
MFKMLTVAGVYAQKCSAAYNGPETEAFVESKVADELACCQLQNRDSNCKIAAAKTPIFTAGRQAANLQLCIGKYTVPQEARVNEGYDVTNVLLAGIKFYSSPFLSV